MNNANYHSTGSFLNDLYTNSGAVATGANAHWSLSSNSGTGAGTVPATGPSGSGTQGRGFDGTSASNYLYVGNSTDGHFQLYNWNGGSWSVGFWVNITDTTWYDGIASQVIIFDDLDGNGTNQCWIRLAHGTQSIDAWISGNQLTQVTPIVWSNNTWHSVVITNQGGGGTGVKTMYLDGVAVATNDVHSPNFYSNGPQHNIGKIDPTNGGLLQGALYNLCVWSRVLTAADAAAFNKQVAGNIKLPSKPFVNVVDYGADPTGTIDSQPGIQAAISACTSSALPGTGSGGIVYFPPGLYNISKPIHIGGGMWYALTLLGCGGSAIAAGAQTFSGVGTVIQGNFQDYLIVVGDEGNNPVTLIQGIGFQQNYNGATMTGSRSTMMDPANTDGRGCIYLGSGVGSKISCCTFSLTQGIGICAMFPFNTSIECCNIQGGYGGTGATNQCIGIWTTGNVNSCKIQGCGIGVAVSPQQCGMYQNMDIEKGGYGIVLGYSPLRYFGGSAASPIYYPAGNDLINCACVTNITFESHYVTFLWVAWVNNVFISSVTAGSFANHMSYGLQVDQANNSTFANLSFTGDATVAGYTTAAAGINKADGCIFQNVIAVANVSPAPAWIFPIGSGTTSLPNIYTNCAWQDGSMTIAALTNSSQGWPTPSSPGVRAIVTDNDTPVWTSPSGPSNVGKTINPAGAGTHYKVPVRWDGTNWVIAG